MLLGGWWPCPVCSAHPEQGESLAAAGPGGGLSWVLSTMVCRPCGGLMRLGRAVRFVADVQAKSGFC